MFQAIPLTASPVYCGPAFLIAVVDEARVVIEPDEHDNMQAVPVIVSCGQGIYFLFLVQFP